MDQEEAAMEKEPDVANITRMARAIIEIVNDQDRDDVIRALISVMVPMFVYAPEPRSDAVRQILQYMETEILAHLPEVVEVLTGHRH